MTRIDPWLFRLDQPATAIARLAGLLSPDEMARAAAFRHDRHRHRFIARRGQLRLLLARLSGCSPAAIRFAYGGHGKPFLPDAPDLHFGTSSAEGVGLCVVATDGPVGCDVAVDQPVPGLLGVARLLFHPDEQAAIAGAPRRARRRTFLDIWTKKEAYLKAIGTGLQRAPSGFSVVAGDCVSDDRSDAYRNHIVSALPINGCSSHVAVPRSAHPAPRLSPISVLDMPSAD